MRDATHTSPPVQHTVISTRRTRGELPLPSKEHPLFPPPALLTSLILNNLGRASPQRRVARVAKFSFLLLNIRLFESFFFFLSDIVHYFFCILSFIFIFLFFYLFILMALVSLEKIIQFIEFVSRKM